MECFAVLILHDDNISAWSDYSKESAIRQEHHRTERVAAELNGLNHL
jgi:hypothetical protein